MMLLQGLLRWAALLLAICVLCVGTVSAADKPVTVKVSLVGGGGEEDLQPFQTALGKVQGIKFTEADIKSSDIKREEMLFTKPFTLELTDVSKTDVGAVAKAIATADTKTKAKVTPGVYLVIGYDAGGAKDDQLRDTLSTVKGVEARHSFVGDINLWIKLDGSGDARLADIRKALKDVSIPIKD
jgi:hypothetical protein